ALAVRQRHRFRHLARRPPAGDRAGGRHRLARRPGVARSPGQAGAGRRVRARPPDRRAAGRHAGRGVRPACPHRRRDWAVTPGVATDVMATDVITLITEDHRKVEALFERLKKEEGDIPSAVAELHALLTAHARAEEDRVYPGIDAHHE